MRIVLASGSAARAAMLKSAGVEFDVVVPDVDEAAVKARGGTAREIAETLAGAKARAPIPHDVKSSLVIGSDQTLEFDGQTLSKAASLSSLRANLVRLRGRTHALHSAVAVARDGAVIWSHASTTKLTMRAVSDTFLDDYITRHGEQVRSSLGGYWFEAEGAQLFDRVEGDYFTILGMPLLPLLGFLRGAGAMSVMITAGGVVDRRSAHSLSPVMHQAWLAAAGIDGRSMTPYEPDQDRFADFIRAHRGVGSRGLNVTIPFKLEALGTSRTRRPPAPSSRRGRQPAGVQGRRRDPGATTPMARACSQPSPSRRRGSIRRRGPSVILGAGGAARGAAAAFVDAGALEVRIRNRSTANAQALSDLLGSSRRDLRQNPARSDVHAVINATSLGLNGGEGPALDLAALPPSAVVMDMVYRPLETAFLARARATGHRTVDGLAMLIGQARPSFAALFGRPAPAHVDVRALCLAALEANR